ncbi:hypothetical protein VTL71DRAFT_16128 [Oculimacula yallundae]|uniref:Uncharacterized protein n=1 Tax=Oculimacula yallundae TaxID=86028 RepID=A0ABR4CDL0_9HELO
MCLEAFTRHRTELEQLFFAAQKFPYKPRVLRFSSLATGLGINPTEATSIFSTAKSNIHKNLIWLCVIPWGSINVAGGASRNSDPTDATLKLKSKLTTRKIIVMLEAFQMRVIQALQTKNLLASKKKVHYTKKNAWGSVIHPRNPKTEDCFTPQPKSNSQQILLDYSASYLLVCTPQLTQLWSVSMGQLLASLKLPNNSLKWANHPDDERTLLCFGFSDIKKFNWANLHEKSSLGFGRVLADKELLQNQPALFRLGSTDWPLGPDEFTTFVDKSFATPDRSLILARTSRASDHRGRRKQFMTFRATDLRGDNVSNVNTASALPEHILSRIEIALGFLDSRCIKGFWESSSRNQDATVLAFLDKDMWGPHASQTFDTCLAVDDLDIKGRGVMIDTSVSPGIHQVSSEYEIKQVVTREWQRSRKLLLT